MNKDLNLIMETVQRAKHEVAEARNQAAADEELEVLADVELGLEWVMNKLEKLQTKGP